MSQTTTVPREVLAPPATEPLATPPSPRAGRGFWHRVKSFIPTVALMGILGGIAVWGHSTHWTLPKFSLLAGDSVAKIDDWCEEHGVPESTCVICNPELLPKQPDYGWCAEHGVHNCLLHHPDVAQVKESPKITTADFERAARALAIRERTQNNEACKAYQQLIQFASVDSVKQAGVDVELVERKPISETIAGSGEITYDQTRFANVSSRAPGAIWKVTKNVGDQVKAGEILAVVDSGLIGHAKGELIDALVQESLWQRTVERYQNIGTGVVPGRQVLEAEAAYEKARVDVLRAQQTLANLGLAVELDELRGLSPEQQIIHLRQVAHVDSDDGSLVDGGSQGTSANLLPIRAPMPGTIVERSVVAGEVVETADVLFQIADTSRMWLTLNVPLEDATYLSLGQPVRFRPDGSKQQVSGNLSWISTSADHETRMLKVRAELPNADGMLRDEIFGSGEIVLREDPKAVVVPNEAVHWEGCCQVVFVRNKHYFDSPESPKLFHVRSVRTAVKNDAFTEIIAGVLPGEVVVTTGSDVLRAQLLKNSLGEGCTCGQ